MKTRESRYAQLSEGQKMVVSGRGVGVGLSSQLTSYLGPEENLPYYTSALESLRELVEGWASAEYWLTGFTLWANGGGEEPVTPGTMRTKVANFRKGVAAFVEEHALQQKDIDHFDGKFLVTLIAWLKSIKQIGSSEQTYSLTTQKTFYGVATQFLKCLAANPVTSKKIAQHIEFPVEPYAGAHRATKKTRRLDDHLWEQIYAASKREALTQIRDTQEAWKQLANHYGDLPRPCRTVLEAQLVITSRFDNAIPRADVIEKEDKQLYREMQAVGGYREVTRVIQPTARALVPFVLLFAIYLVANTTSLLKIKLTAITNAEILGVLRIVFGIEKPRGTDYSRSFVLDSSDALSPARLVRFLEYWGRRLRIASGSSALFVFSTKDGVVREFFPDAASQDIAWSHNFSAFLKDNGLPSVNLREIRMTGLDIARKISGNDLRAVRALGGQKADTVIREHYESDAANLRMNEELAEVMVSMEGWAATRGSTDHRPGANAVDLLAATPGWSCHDPFDSPIVGEKKGRSCRAFGQCPSCPLASLNVRSARALARTLQLREELESARDYLPLARWANVFKPVAQKLDKTWIPLFADANVREAASKLNLGPIGRLE